MPARPLPAIGTSNPAEAPLPPFHTAHEWRSVRLHDSWIGRCLSSCHRSVPADLILTRLESVSARSPPQGVPFAASACLSFVITQAQDRGQTMDPSLVQCRYPVSPAEPIFANLDDSYRALEPQPGMKSAGWLVGHVAVSGHFAPLLFGRPSRCPLAW